ncbi:MAG: hypothetical protein O7A03_07675, partial [Alphaproteobacteria bacterium]|nr:hypothetical protein [Alphaproteobacteria bacterium]
MYMPFCGASAQRGPYAATLITGLSAALLLSGCDILVQGFPEGPYIEPGPAVSRPNASVALAGGASSGAGTGLALASMSAAVPNHERMGVQLDGMAGISGGDETWGVGGHLFVRDPLVGLLGVTSRYTEVDGDGLGR